MPLAHNRRCQIQAGLDGLCRFKAQVFAQPATGDQHPNRQPRPLVTSSGTHAEGRPSNWLNHRAHRLFARSRLAFRGALGLGPFVPQQRACGDCVGMSVLCHELPSLSIGLPCIFGWALAELAPIGARHMTRLFQRLRKAEKPTANGPAVGPPLTGPLVLNCCPGEELETPPGPFAKKSTRQAGQSLPRIRSHQLRKALMSVDYWCVEPIFKSCEIAVTSCAGANGFSRRMLLGTPCDGH